MHIWMDVHIFTAMHMHMSSTCDRDRDVRKDLKYFCVLICFDCLHFTDVSVLVCNYIHPQGQ